ncbi:PQQ-dependent sugar dehydrogenase [Thalassococcus sp. S3]|uniref:PQQ-dependent sugar dehydrogenase n=1 Tax=Thalassococcus sp. S3 TaxID=2017482 RepID=UPI001024724E|nr:PQQ-dependent sugar dehydrogenase [Thalassococcus sp. S3]QBF33481.1 hypothetical protein CFI11_20030 [Thalassococcus sp. S3]
MKTYLHAAAVGLLPIWAASAAADTSQREILTSQHGFLLTPVAAGLEHPWGLDFLPDGRKIVTERPGRIRLVSPEGHLSEPWANVPDIVSEFRDGLFDVSVSPDFAADSTIFFSFSRKEGDERWLQVARARLVDDALHDLTIIHEAEMRVESDEGFGSRIRFDQEGHLLITVGDHMAVEQAQDTSNTIGSIIRISRDGEARANAMAGHDAIVANGFKNPQGLAIHPVTGQVWATDHGGLGGDEINQIQGGGNYGWPDRTFGIDDAPRAVVTGDYVEPLFTWGVSPTVALSGLEVYTGDDFAFWQGDLFAGSLLQSALIRVMLNDDGQVAGTEYVLDGEIGRVRDVRQGPDGMLYVLNDEFEGGIFRISPTS